MRYYNNVVEAIGRTPLIRLGRICEGLKPLMLAKLESVNPGGSVKDRIASLMIDEAEHGGLLKPGGTIIEPTSGNTGVGLAMVAALRGYKTIFLMPDKMSKDKELLLKAYGAKVIRTPTVPPEDPRSNIQTAERLLKKTPNSFMPNQYANMANPEAHYRTTGPEIWNDTDGRITHFVAGIGTGGTMAGVGRYLKEKNKRVKIIGADPEGSIYALKFYKKKGTIHQYKTEGIGEDFMPKTSDLSVVDQIITVSDRDAMLTARRLVREEGLLVGSSSGCAVWAALRVAKTLKKDDIMVVLLPDTGRNYLSTLYNDEWMKSNRFL